MSNKRAIRFVQALLISPYAFLNGGEEFQVPKKTRPVSLPRADVERLVSEGVLLLCEGRCSASELARQWVKRSLLDKDPFANQHRSKMLETNKVQVNQLEGPVSQLSIAKKGTGPFLQKHHVAAANKIHVLFQGAQMLQRTTMSYDPTRSGAAVVKNGFGQEMGERAIDARRKLKACLQNMPDDCAGVILDVCGFQKGLQLVEIERKWPRRSAKLILRVGLEKAARHFGLSVSAV
ncbi:MAG: DUF6456 domain-containing protein, partial [Devosiaceae bacterium]|nr:DUF6456 domain-containing protein [Devosiaceae bacterium]